jgi:alpha-L-rhamnosidase
MIPSRHLFLCCVTLMLAVVAIVQAAAPLPLNNLRCEYKTNPVGIDEMHPRLSWELVSADRGTLQIACQIRVAVSESNLDKNKLVWDSGKQASAASSQSGYQGPLLESGQRYYWQVQVWDNQGRSSGWSKPALWEMGLLRASDWQARWIAPNLVEEAANSTPGRPPQARAGL